MTLTRVERWILANQYRILECVDRKNAEGYQHAREAIERGYEFLYDDCAISIYDSPNIISSEECSYVIDVMEMFSVIQRTYDSLTDKSEIPSYLIDFPGFDGTNELPYLGFAKFFCESRQAFQHLRKSDDSFNSHCSTRELYQRMLAAWRESSDKHRLTKGDLIRITQAAIHPDNRKN